jgi:YesN/AraC family two-component response regulator
MKALPFYRNTFFNRLILSYTALAVLLIGLAGGYLYSQANRMMVDEIARDSQNRLTTVKNYVEQTLLKKYEDNLQNKALSTIYIQNSSYLNYLLDNGWEDNSSRIMSVRQDLEMFRQAIDGAYNFTVYFQKGDYVIDSNSFYAKPENSTDAAFIRQLNQTVQNRWIFRTLSDPNNSTVNGKQVMTYVVKLPYGSQGVFTKGYLYVDVDLDYLNQAAAKIVSSPNERLYIFDANRKLFVQTAEANQKEIDLVQNTIRANETVRRMEGGNDGSIVLSYLDGKNSANGFTYAMIRPLNSFVLASNQFKAKIFVGCGLVLLLGLVISYIISRRLYIPMKKLVHHIRSLYQPGISPAQANEYMIIGNALNFMGEKIVTLESQAKKNEMKNLVLGTGFGLEHMDGLPQGTHYLVAHIVFEEGSSEKFKQRFDHFEHPVRCELVSLNPKEAAIIYFIDSSGESDEDAIAAAMQQIQEQVREEFRFGAGLGTQVQSPEEIPISYQLAQLAYRYRFLHGPEAIVLHSNIAAFDPAPQLFTFETYKNALKAGNVNGAERFIDEFAAILRERSLQLEAVELALLQLVSTLYQVVIELELQRLVPPSNLFDELKKDTLSATIDSIRTLSAQIAVHMKQSDNHAHAEVIGKLKSYIDEHLHEELSLNLLSEVASLAPAYISTLFGEVMKESFTEYVTRTRLEKAAAMLREGDKLSVTEIASLVGYRNPQYFHNKFKARFGITPVQYRQAKQEIGVAK